MFPRFILSAGKEKQWPQEKLLWKNTSSKHLSELLKKILLKRQTLSLTLSSLTPRVYWPSTHHTVLPYSGTLFLILGVTHKDLKTYSRQCSEKQTGCGRSNLSQWNTRQPPQRQQTRAGELVYDRKLATKKEGNVWGREGNQYDNDSWK